MTVHAADLLSDRARISPDRPALLEVHTGLRLTYAELDRRASRSANHLRERYGVGHGDRVAILAHNGVPHLDLLYGLPRIGAVFAPLNWRLTAEELRYIVTDLDPRVVLYGPEMADVGAALAAGADGPTLVPLDEYEAELAVAPDRIPDRPPLEPDSPLCILYTSGTTGKPKGAVLPHRQVVWNCISTVAAWGLREDDVTPVLTPLFHTGGLFALLAPVLYAGGRVVLARGFDADESLRLIAGERCTVVLGVPTLFRMWTDAPGFASADLSSVRFFISGGAVCPPELMDRWRREKGVAFRQGYGLTEVGPNCFTMSDEQSVGKPGSVGLPTLHLRTRLVDPVSLRDVGDDEAGELWLAGPQVCSGYWRNPAATAEVLVDGWFRTGDTFRRDADGFHFVVGRYKDMIKSGGENVYAAEVEAVYRDHPAVVDCALIGEPDARWGEVGLLVAAVRRGAGLTEAALLEHGVGRLARYKIPKRAVLVESLPYSSYGKVRKSELRELHLPRAAEKEPST